MKPRIFIASSRERLDLARAAQEDLEHDIESTVWNQGVFELSRSSMASLMDVLNESDFGLFILAPDDITAMRDKTNQTVRDNVIFELGLFAGHLGIERCFMIVPSDTEDLHLPSDLAGLTPASYDSGRQDGNMVAALGPACNRIRRAVQKLGMLEVAAPPEESQGAEAEFCSDAIDCVAIIRSWMGHRNSSLNTAVIRYNDVDRELKLSPGSARLYIEQAASKYDYIPSMKGKDTILFERG